MIDQTGERAGAERGSATLGATNRPPRRPGKPNHEKAEPGDSQLCSKEVGDWVPRAQRKGGSRGPRKEPVKDIRVVLLASTLASPKLPNSHIRRSDVRRNSDARRKGRREAGKQRQVPRQFPSALRTIQPTRRYGDANNLQQMYRGEREVKASPISATKQRQRTE